MLVLRFEVDAPEYAVQGIKEHLAMALERYGDVRLVSVEAAQGTPRQMNINAWAAACGYKEAYQRARRR